jgi:CDP-6-deoxy-D-xylo-4-hexulose-3-dehydrase
MRWPLMGDTITFMDRLKMAKFVMTTDKFTNGKKVYEFEKKWSKWLGCKHSLFVSSGSTANFLLIAAVIEQYGLKPGDKVLVPGCTWMTNVAPIIQLGLTPIFCDINLQNFSFDLIEARNIASKHPDIKIVFATHLLGFPAPISDLDEIFPNAMILEDICESHGCEYKGESYSPTKHGADSLGATFSFYFGHHMTTIEGGMVCTNNSNLYDLMRMKRSHGMARESTFFDVYAAEYPNIDKQFLFMTDGYNFRNHEICAVLGIEQLKRLTDMNAQRQENYLAYCNTIKFYDMLFESHDFNQYASNFCFPFVCKTETTMRKLKDLFIRHGIEYRPIVSGNLLEQPFLHNYELETTKRITNLDIIQTRGIYIGNNHFVTSKDMKFLHNIIGEIF